MDKANLTPNDIGDKILNASIHALPEINLRIEFKENYNFLKGIVEGGIIIITKYIQSPYMIWTGMPDAFLTLILQRAILGVEAYVPGAVWAELHRRGKFKQEDMNFIHNPYDLNGYGVPDKYYNSLPRLIDKNLTLEKYSDNDWKLVKDFYKKVRNPLFHGKQICGCKSFQRDAAVILDGYDVLNKIYEWVDSWYDMN